MLPLISGSVVAAALLVLIHFFGLRLRQKLEFSHIQFLTALISRTQSVRRINNYLLLLLRIVFVASALAAFLLYFFQEKNGIMASNREVSFILDGSWSMKSASAEKGQSKYDLAKNDVQEITSFFQTKKRNNKDSETDSNSDDLITLSRPEDILTSVKEQSRSGKTYILSDFQRASFPVEALQSLPKNQQITLVSYSSDDVPNLYIDSVWLEQPFLLPESQADIAVRVTSSLLKTSTQVKVTASEGQKLLGTTQVLLEPVQKATVHFKIPVSGKGIKKVIFEVEDPEGPFDNQHYVVIPEPVSVSIKVDRSIASNHPILQAYKAESAFKLAKEGKSTTGLWVLDIPANDLDGSLLSNVKAWINASGSVLFVPSANAQQRSSVEFLASMGLRGITEENNEIGAKSLKQPDLSDSFFKQIFEKEVKNMKMPEATPVLRWQSSYHTILRFTDNTPFLSTFKVGNGNVHLFAAPITNASAFVAHPLFVPVLYQLALSSNSSEVKLAHETASRNIIIPLKSGSASKQPYALRMGEQSFIPDQKVQQNHLVMTLPASLSKPGFYNLQLEDKVISTVALNIPKSESKLEGYTIDELKEIMVGHGANVQVVEPEERISLQKQLDKEDSGASLWKYCLILCILCLMVEAIILSKKRSGSVI